MIIKEFGRFMMTLPLRIMHRLPYRDKLTYQFMMQLAKEYEKQDEDFCLICWRPQYASQVVSVEQETKIRKMVAIVMSGPLIAKDNFTLETVKLYEKLYPGSTVIISIWENESLNIINQLKATGNCEVLLNELPRDFRMYDSDLTMAGLRRAKELGKEYVFITRCELRFVKLGLIDFLVALCKEFSVDKEICY